MSTDSQTVPLTGKEQPTVPLTGKEYAALQSLFATRSAFKTAAPRLENRAELAGVKDEMEQLIQLSQTVMDKLLRTIPRAKLQHVLYNFDLTRVYVTIEAQGIPTKSLTNYTLVPTGALDYVLNAFIDNYCLMCQSSEIEGRKCPHRIAMEGCLPFAVRVDRDSEKCRFADLSLGFVNQIDQ